MNAGKVGYYQRFSPLAGIRFVESSGWQPKLRQSISFSPLAGIRFVESALGFGGLVRLRGNVSVPLRGLGSWKVLRGELGSQYVRVSVPLRGLGSWKAGNIRES